MLQPAFYVLLIVVYLLVGFGFYEAGKDRGERKKGPYKFFAIITGWTLYVMLISISGFLADFSLPPKMVMYVVLPALMLIAVFFSIRKTSAIIAAFPIALPVYFQTFRIFVELLIWGLYKEGIGPELVTFEGRNLDILAGISAPIVGYLSYNRKVLSHKAVLVWNILGLLLLVNIVSLFITLVVKPQVWGFEQIPIDVKFTNPPYIFIAAVFMPVAVFMHVMSIRKTLTVLKQRRH